MVTSELLYSAFGAIVGAHKAGVQFVHDTNQIKDRSPELRLPACGWNLPTCGQFVEGETEVFTDTFTLSLLFVDQTASDRAAGDMLHAHTRMEAIAKQCVGRFFDLYIKDSTEFQNVDIDLELLGTITYPPVWDEGTTMLTGVTAVFTVKATQPECVDTYFNL